MLKSLSINTVKHIQNRFSKKGRTEVSEEMFKVECQNTVKQPPDFHATMGNVKCATYLFLKGWMERNILPLRRTTVPNYPRNLAQQKKIITTVSNLKTKGKYGSNKQKHSSSLVHINE